MKKEATKAEKLAELLKKADSHPLMKAIQEEESASLLAKRTEAAANIAALEEEREEVLSRLQAILGKKKKKLKQAKVALDVSTGEFNKANAELLSKGHNFSIAISKEKAILYETADPMIDEAINFFDEKLAYLRSPGRISQTASGSEKNLIGWTKITRAQSNVSAVRAALTFCQAAIKELERMKFAPILDKKRIEQLKASIPPIDVFSVYQGEKPLEGTP